MFSKIKWVTRVIGLLLISKHISFVAADFGDCPDLTNASSSCSDIGASTECTIICKSSNKLYAIDNSSTATKKKELNGYYLFDNNYSLVTTGAGTLLYYSDNTNGLSSKTKTDGYYINSDKTSNYIKCKNGSCTVEANPTDTSCNIGQLYEDSGAIKLCLATGIGATFVADKKYLISYTSDSIFSASVTDGKFGVVSFTTNSMTIDTSVTSSSQVCASSILDISDPTSGDTCSSGTLYSLCTSGICQKICKVGSGVNCEASKYYLVDSETSSTPVTGTNDGHLFYCTAADTRCTEVSVKGYYVNDKDNAFYCNGTAGNCKKETITAGATCSSTTVGKLALDSNDPIICLSSTVSKKFSSNDVSYLIGYVSNNVFGITSGKMGLVKIENSSVVLIPSDGYVIEKKNSPNIVTNTDTDEGSLYSCSAGLCQLVDESSIKTGVYINIGGTGTHIICNTDKCTVNDNPSDNTCNIGKPLLDTDLYICLDGTKKAKFTTGTTVEKYLVKHDADSIFADLTSTDKFGYIVVNSTTITIDTTYNNDYGVCVDTTFEVKSLLSSSTTTCSTGTKYGFCSNGICYQTCDVTLGTSPCTANTYYLVKDKTLSIPEISSSIPGYLYYCSDGSSPCTEKFEKGYYVNSFGDAYQCTGTSKSCTKVTVVETDLCTTGNIGKLVKQGTTDAENTSGTSFCLNYKDSSGIEKMITKDVGTYLLTFAANNIFGVESGQMGLISIKDNSATLLKGNGYCAEDGTNSNILGTSTSTSTTLYLCSEGLCNIVSNIDIKVGYYRNLGGTTQGTSDYITCSISENEKVCKVINVSGTDCSTGSNPGDIIYAANTQYEICLTSDISIPLVSNVDTNNGLYFADASDEDNADYVFCTTKEDGYILIDIENENVFIHEEETSVELYRYGDKTNLKLINFNTDSSTYCNANVIKSDNTPEEFSLMDEDEEDTPNYYKLESATPSTPANGSGNP